MSDGTDSTTRCGAAVTALALAGMVALAAPAPAAAQIVFDIDTPSSFMEELREETASGEPVDAERLLGWLAREMELGYRGEEGMEAQFYALFVNERGDVEARIESRPFRVMPGDNAAGEHLDVRGTAGMVERYFPDTAFGLDDYYFPDTVFFPDTAFDEDGVIENGSALMPGMRLERGQRALIVVAVPADLASGPSETGKTIVGPAVLVFGGSDR